MLNKIKRPNLNNIKESNDTETDSDSDNKRPDIKIENEATALIAEVASTNIDLPDFLDLESEICFDSDDLTETIALELKPNTEPTLETPTIETPTSTNIDGEKASEIKELKRENKQLKR